MDLRPELWSLNTNDKGHLMIGGCDAVDLADEYGTPLYAINETRLQENYDRFCRAFASRYPKVEVYYSYKTNCIPGVLQVLHERGAKAEVISGYELWLALKLGINPDSIVFNGPNKTDEELATAIRHSVKLINVDSIAEIERVDRIAGELGIKANLGIRVCPGVVPKGMNPFTATGSRKAHFGVDLKTGEAFKAFEKATAANNVNLLAMHSHIGPVVWASEDIPAEGHYCFIGLINSGNDPAPNPNSIVSLNDFYNFIRENNNATWKNFNVIDMFAGSVNALGFHIQGWSGNDIYSDLKIDLSPLPASTEVNLKILKRLCVEASADGLTKIGESTLYNKYRVSSGGVSILRNIKLKSREDCIATLEFILPDSIPDGAYEVSVAQAVNNSEMGRITQLLAVGDHPFVANINTGELHNNTCQWVRKMSSRNKVAYKEVSRAIKHNYNGCRYCLTAYDTG